MKEIRNHIIILSFAALHVLMALLCREIGVSDELILTLLTMTMIAIICYHRKMDVEFTAIAIVVGNLVGYAIGIGMARLLKVSSVWDAAISTLLTTILLGYGTLGISYAFKSNDKRKPNESDIIWMVGAIALVFLARVIVILIHKSRTIGAISISEDTLYFLSSCAALIFVLFIFIGSYVIIARRKAMEEREKRHLAQFRYMKLSQQVNPHFLFNSLNILDGLVTDVKTEQASTYIHKLASCYRYLIKNEDETTVKLRDEMEFVDKYIDLLKVRFQDGLQVIEEVTPAALSKNVVPCSIQLLIENATKHNAAVESNPLTIHITIDDEKIVVSNALRPKITTTSSTGLGLKYISQQYKDLSGKDITITKTDTDYTVEMPLI